MFDPSGRSYRRSSARNMLTSFAKLLLALIVLAVLSMGVI